MESFKEPDYDPNYTRLLDALIEYLDSVGQREQVNINQRDITIIKALIEFYDYEIYDNQDIVDIMDDVKMRVEEIEGVEEKKNGSH